MRLNTIAARSKIKARREPNWESHGKGKALGLRKLKDDPEGTFIARGTDSNGKRVHKSLGSLDHIPARERYDEALRQAREWWDHLDAGGLSGAKTIIDACNQYIEYVCRKKNDKMAGRDIERRFMQYVLSDPRFANLELSRLTKQHVSDFRKRLERTPNKAGPNKGTIRSSSTINRDMTCLRAALNHALDNQWVTSNCWKSALRPISSSDDKTVDRSRTEYLSKMQRAQLANNAGSALGELIKGMSLIPLRPGAMAKLTVSDFDRKTGRLTISQDKVNNRQILLPKVQSAFLSGLVRNKLPSAPIFSTDDGSFWNKDKWKKPFKSAVAKTGLPTKTVMYTLRHSVITDLITQGVPVLTVAQLSGTSVRMIEKHYGKLLDDSAVKALESLAL